jgi:hypothetical protein
MWMLQRLDPDRRRRRLQLLAELSGAKSAGLIGAGSARDRRRTADARGDKLRELIAMRRRLAG